MVSKEDNHGARWYQPMREVPSSAQNPPPLFPPFLPPIKGVLWALPRPRTVKRFNPGEGQRGG